MVLSAMCMNGCRPATTPIVSDGSTTGSRLYASYCTQCHGADARNDRDGTEPQMRLTDAIALTAPEWHSIVLHGRKAMPAFAGRLKPADIDAIHLYVKTQLRINNAP
jgi:mono/diheme cytochrome c family protein